MAYDLHIERKEDSTPISYREWCEAVEATLGLRLSQEEATLANPVTGEGIRIAGRAGDAEVFFPGESIWSPVFRWGENSAAFSAKWVNNDPSHPVWAGASALATLLQADIRGDEGETYNLVTGELTS
ncbi:hypothetical protein [Luteolibacter sp. Populi]|uniref:hypothetical protein n=1 Tax=Luteolibacter sp. Populi TaxID=3230487 RepID=UPI0034659A49